MEEILSQIWEKKNLELLFSLAISFFVEFLTIDYILEYFSALSRKTRRQSLHLC